MGFFVVLSRIVVPGLASLLVASAGAAQSPAAKISFEPYSLRTFDGQTHSIEIGKLIVPESRTKPNGRQDTIAFYRLRASNDQSALGPPIVFLMGGPGIPASVMAPIPPYWQLFDALRESGDVILLDQRGLGLSSPKVDCPALSTPFDTAFLTSHAALVNAYRSVVGSCADAWRAKGVDPRSFSDVAVADDIDDIRKALGSQQVSLLGFSYGTKLAMTYARRFPDRLSRIVLQGPTDADLEYHDALQRDSLLTRIARLATADTTSGPFSKNLITRIRNLFDRAVRQPIRVKIGRAISRDSVMIPIGRDGLRGLVEGHMADPRLPAFIATTENGDLTILARWVESMYNDFSGGAGTLMARAMTCSARPSAARRAKVDAAVSRSLFGGSFDNFAADPAFCGGLGGQAPAIQMHAAKKINAPVLFITGQLDDRTPPGNDIVLEKEFSSSVRITMPNGGHELLTYTAVRQLVADFFAGRDVRARQLRADAPRFMSIEEAKQPPRRRGQ